MLKFLIIQTAFIGDVVLATSLIEKIHKYFPEAQIDFLLRKGNEGILKGHPYLQNVFVWDKKNGKYKNIFKLSRQLQAESYDYAINLQRFFSSGLFTILSGANTKIGFSKNPLSFLFDQKVKHSIQKGIHELNRNNALIENLTNNKSERPVIYPGKSDFELLNSYQIDRYVCIAPASVWFTKQLPVEKWVELSKLLSKNYKLIFIGAQADKSLSDNIIQSAQIGNVLNLCGKLSLLQSAALMKGASMNYVNDSAPLHLTSAVNAPVTAFFCSTVPEFGFGPLSDKSIIAQIDYSLKCRPCGLHGKKACPQQHFKCAFDIQVNRYLV